MLIVFSVAMSPSLRVAHVIVGTASRREARVKSCVSDTVTSPVENRLIISDPVL
jgi:hypothetical protein